MTSAVQAMEAQSRVTNNTDDLLATLTGATTTVTYGPFYNPHSMLRIAVNISAITAGSLTVTIQGIDQSSGATYTVLASSALASTGLTLLAVSPYISASANVRAQTEPPVWYQITAAAATGPVNATIAAHGIGQ